MSGRVTNLYRYAVKGLSADELSVATLERNYGMPFDRVYALQFDSLPATEDTKELTQFKPFDPSWIHKRNFMAAFTSGDVLSPFRTTFDETNSALTIM